MLIFHISYMIYYICFMITKINLRDQVKNILLQRMKSGVLNAGDPISISGLAQELEVSAIPVREALAQLEQVKIIKAIPNRGFVVSPVDEDQIKPLYELIASLESLAIENTVYDTNHIILLQKQQEVFRQTTSAIERINADMDFHDTLTKKYASPTAQQILGDLKIRIFFYEKKFMDQNGFYNDSEDHHQDIIEQLKKGNSQAAIQAVKRNWMQILNFES